MVKQLLMVMVVACAFLSSCSKKEEPQPLPQSNDHKVLEYPRNPTYKTGIVIDAQTGRRAFSIVFEIAYGRIQEIAFEGEWKFTLPKGSATFRLTEQDFTWRQDGRRTIGTSTTDLGDFLAQPDVKHEVKTLDYHLLIDGVWWHAKK